MNFRPQLLALVLLVLPAIALLLFGPRGGRDVPTDRVVVHYWEKWSGVEGQTIQNIVRRFNDTVGREKAIWVEYSLVSNVDQRMLISTAGGDPPDIAGLFDHIIPQYADQGALTPLDDFVAEHQIDLSAFKPVWLDICRYQGKLYALPSTPYTIALFYNRELFREAGLDPDSPPRTTAELSNFALKLTRRDASGDKIVQLGFTASPAMLGWWPWVWPCYFDARLWDGARCLVDSPQSQAAAEWLRDYRVAAGAREVLAFEAAAGAIESADNPFLAGKLAMVFQGPWMANWARRYAPDLDYGVAPFPSSSAERHNQFASLDNFVIPHGAQHPREAMIFLEYLMRQRVLEDLCKGHGKVSPFRNPRPEFFDGHPNKWIHAFDEMAASPRAFGYPPMPMWAQARTEFLASLNSILRGDKTPAAALSEAQKNMDRIVAEYQRMSARRAGRP